MPDPALLALMRHFASPPAAIVQPADIVDAEPFLSALEAVADDRDRDFRDWSRRSAALQDAMSSAVRSQPDAFSIASFDDLISRLERFIIWERRSLTKRDRLWRGREVSGRMQALRERLAARDSSRIEAADDLVLFLRAMRAEADPDSRGGSTFDDPDALERHILGVSA